MSIQIGDLIDRVRTQHPGFTVERHPDAAVVEFVSTRHRMRLRQLTEFLKDRLSEARKIADTIANSLVGVDENGSQFAVTTDADGYDVVVDATTGALYRGPTAIATDPYGTAAGGFPMPATSLRLLDVYAEMADTGAFRPVTIIPQYDYANRSGAGQLLAVINGWRLVPVINPPTSAAGAGITVGAQTLWANVANVVFAWVDEPVRFTLTGTWRTQTLTGPDTYMDLLEADVTVFLAQREHSLNPDGFPDSLVAVHAKLSDDLVAAALEGARRDHRPLLFHQAKRNR